MVDPIRKWLKKREREKRKIERTARKLEKRGLPSRVAKSLAKRVVAGDYTIDEAVQAYKGAKKSRVKRLSKELTGRESSGSILNRIGEFAGRASDNLYNAFGFDLGFDPLEEPGPRRSRKTKRSGKSRRRKRR